MRMPPEKNEIGSFRLAVVDVGVTGDDRNPQKNESKHFPFEVVDVNSSGADLRSKE